MYCDYDFIDSEGLQYDADELEYEADYWTRLEHQYAGMAMQAIISKQAVGHKLDTITNLCCDIAHALVEKMKEERK